jgi:hypothetical protein
MACTRIVAIIPLCFAKYNAGSCLRDGLFLKWEQIICIPVVAHQGRTLPLSSHNGAITGDFLPQSIDHSSERVETPFVIPRLVVSVLQEASLSTWQNSSTISVLQVASPSANMIEYIADFTEQPLGKGTGGWTVDDDYGPRKHTWQRVQPLLFAIHEAFFWVQEQDDEVQVSQLSMIR